MPRKLEIETNICKVCNKLVRDNQKDINSNICLCWYHSKCIGMSSNDYDRLSNLL